MATGQQRVVATFGDRRGAESAAAALKKEGFEPRLDVRDDESFALQGQMQDEAKDSVVGPAIGISPPGATRGWFWGGAVGTISGLVLGVVIGLVYAALTDASVGLSILICTIATLVACITVGVNYGGGKGSSPEVQTGEVAADAQPATVVGVDALDEESAEKVTSVFGRFAPTRVDRVGHTTDVG